MTVCKVDSERARVVFLSPMAFAYRKSESAKTR